MKKYVLFGAGEMAKSAAELVGEENIEFCVDNNPKKDNTYLGCVPVYLYKKKKSELSKYSIVISVSDRFTSEIEKQLLEDGFTFFCTISEIQMKLTKERISKRTNYLDVFSRAIDWIINNSVNSEAIICNSLKPLGYPEVTGYYIPSLIRWGYRDLALSYAKWLISIQKEDGSWFDTDDNAPYIFDSAQILKGLLAVRNIVGDSRAFDESIIRGVDWILSCMTEEGRLVTPSQEAWGRDVKTCSEAIHLYCISPIAEAGKRFNRKDYTDKAKKILDYYKNEYASTIENFSLLSHFYAYLMEGLLDMGETELVRNSMNKLVAYQKESGAVPAYNNVDWVCSTGLFQLALVWYRLGECVNADKAFEYAIKLQNETGGWYGSYISEENATETNTYFPTAEISWANKYFLDALYYKSLAQFEKAAPIFLDSISFDDGRYAFVENQIVTLPKKSKILDAGCGKGRYLLNLVQRAPENDYYAVDISENVMKRLDNGRIDIKQGTLTNIPYPNGYFDVVYVCEALEHAIDVDSAAREIARVLKPKGKAIIIDKNKEALGRLMLDEWEQWFGSEELVRTLRKYFYDAEAFEKISYEGKVGDNLFSAWIAIKE